MNDEIEERINEKLDEAYIYDGFEREHIKEKINFLLKQNEEIMETVDVRLLSSGYDDISEFLSMLTVYPEVQEMIANLSIDQYKLFATIIRNIDRNNLDWIATAEDYLYNIQSGKYDELFLDKKFSQKIDEFYQKITSDEPLSDKDSQKIEEITGLLTNMNIFDIKNYNQLNNINLNKKCNDLLIGSIESDYVSNLTKSDKLRNAILLKRFGHGLDVAKLILDRYAEDYDEIVEIVNNENDDEIRKYVEERRKITDPEKVDLEIKRIKKENQAVKEYLTALKTITETHDIEKLKQYYSQIHDVSSINQSYRMDSVIRKFFCRQKNKSLYIPKEEDKTIIDGREVYMIQDDFNISLNSLNSYANSLDWDVKLLANHGICTTYMANNNMNHAVINGACLGFTDFDERSLYVSSPFDLGSSRFVQNMNISRAKAITNEEVDVKFHTPKSQIDRTRRRHNEDLNERRELDPNKIDIANEKFKKQPSYSVYFSETSLYNFLYGDGNEILNSENLANCLNWDGLYDVEYRRKLVEDYAMNDPIWAETLKETDKRNVDIVVVDRTYMSLRERLKVDQMENEIMNYDIDTLNYSDKDMDYFLHLMERMIVESENNRAGNSITDSLKGDGTGNLIHPEVREKLWSKEIMEDRLNKLEQKIQSLDPQRQKMCYEKLIQITKGELEKYNHHDWFEVDPGYDLNGYLSHFIMEKSGYEPIDTFELLNEVDSETGRTGGELVCEAIGDIRELKEYQSSCEAIHGQKHINNVVLFSYLIGKNEGVLDSEGMDLLIQAAKFHDVGRDGNWNGLGNGNRHDYDQVPHADPGALGAEYYMKKEKRDDGSDKYSDEQIAIVKAAISYHEVHEKDHNKFDEYAFEKLCERYGISPENREKAKLICVYLKDADAVDRTRFRYEYTDDIYNIPEDKKYLRRCSDNLDISYLRTDSSILLVEKAREIHKDLLQKECEYMYDEYGNKINEAPKTLITSCLEPYEYAITNKKEKYTDPDNINKIAQFLQNKQDEKDNKEVNELMDVCKKTDKSLLATLRRWGSSFIKQLQKMIYRDESVRGL